VFNTNSCRQSGRTPSSSRRRGRLESRRQPVVEVRAGRRCCGRRRRREQLRQQRSLFRGQCGELREQLKQATGDPKGMTRVRPPALCKLCANQIRQLQNCLCFLAFANHNQRTVDPVAAGSSPVALAQLRQALTTGLDTPRGYTSLDRAVRHVDHRVRRPGGRTRPGP
jgi:hypothetical protein